MKHLISYLTLAFVVYTSSNISAQSINNQYINNNFKNILLKHKEFVSIPNLPEDKDLMLKNIDWVANKYKKLDFKTELLPSPTLPILIAEKTYDPSLKTVLFYFHIDGQPVNPEVWNQNNPFQPVLKAIDENGNWKIINWSKLDGEINDDWRIFARAAADDKAPIIMFLEALEILEIKKSQPKFNIKVIFDPEEEYSSTALLSTLEEYKKRYASDYFIVMDGPIHSSNKPTLTFGCRGIVTCSMTTYGAKLPQHSGHFGNYVPNPVFDLSRLLSSMKNDQGKVLIDGYYDGIEIDAETETLLSSVPFDAKAFDKKLGIQKSEDIGSNYQEALQYPTLNVRQIGTSWKGEGLKTVIPEYAKADLDIRLVPEIEGTKQLEKVKTHIKKQGFYVIDREPSDEEKLSHAKIVKFEYSPSVINAFRTDPNSDFGVKVRSQLKNRFGYDPVSIRIMGGTVPIVPVINTLNVPTLIVPMVNMDNNQHSPNENIRVGNIRQGIKICLAILGTEL